MTSLMSSTSVMELGTDAATADQDPDIDWSSVEEVSSHVSRATLGGMQQLWKQHAASMDIQGKTFAQRVYAGHSQAIKEIASMKTFELKPVIALVNSFTTSIRETVLEALQQMRRQDDEFAQHMYQATRRTFTQNLKAALDARDAWYQDKLKGLKLQHEAILAAARSSAAMELKQQETQHQAELARVMAAHQGQEQQQQQQQAGQPSRPGTATRNSTRKSVSGSGVPPANLPSMHAGALVSESGLSVASDAAARMSQTGMAAGGRCGEAAMEEEAGTSAAIEELRADVEGLTAMVQMEKNEAASWRSKWAQESTKTDGIKRECLQIVTKCEDHVKSLQQKHLAELSQRDYILQRCKDTILNLEARITELSGSPLIEPEEVALLIKHHRTSASNSSSGAAGGDQRALTPPRAGLAGPSLVQVPPGYGPDWTPGLQQPLPQQQQRTASPPGNLSRFSR